MSKKLFLLILLLGLQVSLIAQSKFTWEQVEQRKRHSRILKHNEKELSGKIVKVLYDDGYEYLSGFILETSPGNALKVDINFTLGNALYPYLKREEQIQIKVAGDKDLLLGMLYKTAEDKRAEKSLKIKLTGLAHFQSITSSHGTFDRKNFDRSKIGKGNRYEIVTDAKISAYNKGKRKRIQLIVDNGDTINTYETKNAKKHYLDGKISYMRYSSPLPGMYRKSNHTYHMADSYVFGPTIPSRHDFNMSAMGQRSYFLDESSDLRFIVASTGPKDRVTLTKWLDPKGDTLNMTFTKDFKEKLDNFLTTYGKEDILLHYRSNAFPRVNYLYGLEKNGQLVLLNEASFNAKKASDERFQVLYKHFTDFKDKREKASITIKGTIQKYLTTGQGTYAGFRLEDESGKSKVFRFLGTHGEDILGRFKVGDLVEVTAQNISASDLIKVRFQNAKIDLESFSLPPDFRSNVFFVPQTWITILHDEDKKGRTKHAGFATTKTPYVSHISSGRKELELDINTENQPASGLPSVLSIDIEIAKISKKKGRFTFYMRNGDTLSTRSSKGYKKGEKVSYLQKFPQVLKGQVNKDPNYAQTPIKTLLAKKRQLTGTLEPIYDDWMRLMGYESEVEGKKSRVRISTDLAKNVNAFVSQQRNAPLTLFCNELITSINAPVYYFVMGLQNEQGELVYDNQIRQQQYFEVDTTFSSKVKEVIQHSDLYTFSKTTVILENDFVFSIKNKTFGSIGASSFVGSEITIKGKPLIPRKGEILKDENYRLIKPSQLTLGSIEFKISD